MALCLYAGCSWRGTAVAATDVGHTQRRAAGAAAHRIKSRQAAVMRPTLVGRAGNTLYVMEFVSGQEKGLEGAGLKGAHGSGSLGYVRPTGRIPPA